MLLYELTGIKKYHGLNEYHFLKLLRRMGVTMTSGRYGMVFSHPSWNHVYKVFDNDPYYLHFVNYAIAHPNPHYPRFFKKPMQLHKFLTRFEGGADKWWVVKIEKLNEMTDKTLTDWIVRNIERGMDAYNWIHVLKDDERLGYANEVHSTRSTELPDGNVERGVSAAELFRRYPWFESLSGAALAYNNTDGGHINDMHAGNLMQRSDGTVILIDPAWVGYNPYTAAYEQHMRDMDSYDGSENDNRAPMVSGPSYLKQNRKPPARKEQKHSEMDDDIPF